VNRESPSTTSDAASDGNAHAGEDKDTWLDDRSWHTLETFGDAAQRSGCDVNPDIEQTSKKGRV
jgi:hypothetical protein